MNPLLQVKLRFNNEKNNNNPGPRNLRVNAITTIDKIELLQANLVAILDYYQAIPRFVNNYFVDVNYNDIIAKTNRIKALLKPDGVPTNDTVVGARFSDSPEGMENHIITHYVSHEVIERTLVELGIAKRFLADQLEGLADSTNFHEPNSGLNYNGYGLSKTRIRDIIIDCSVVDSFSVPHITDEPDIDTFLITFFKSELSVPTVLSKLGIDEIKYRYSFYGNDTISITRDLFYLLREKIPYMISMISSDISQLSLEQIDEKPHRNERNIPSPFNEPTIGIIDTLFDETVYFNEWVENHDYLDEVEQTIITSQDREHGTEVASIIVDGPSLNPWLDDKCGRFRARHFGVCVKQISISRLIRKIREIVAQNPDIHVWNLSLGTEEEVSKNFISYDASILDQLQTQYNVVFVVSGTNDNRPTHPNVLRIGSPADSLNSIVVNSVRRNGAPASYSRKGTVLSFFNKPDVSYYGGDYNERITAYSSVSGDVDVYGTSFAAPWVSRKMCYLIDIMGFPREIAKALIIDSSAGWEYKTGNYALKDLIGYGTVPIDINKIVSTDNDEIRFVLYGTAGSYTTSNYAIPVPRDEDNKYPYIARATLCYFPECSRSQGVDYTNRELSLRFGRINSKNTIDDINKNVQEDSGNYTSERLSRKEFRKWENTKFISNILSNNRPLKSYEERLWGIAITSKERLSTRMKYGLNFGAVITLKEVTGTNRIQEFIRACTLRGWIVNEIIIQNRIEVFNTSQEDIHFD